LITFKSDEKAIQATRELRNLEIDGQKINIDVQVKDQSAIRT